MAKARCQNEKCAREEQWTLQKHPENYAGGGPSCPDCGSTDLDIEGESAESAQMQPAREQQAAKPAGQGNPGNMVADVFAIADEEAPTQRRAKAAQNVLGTVGGVVKQFMEYQDQKQQARERRAETAELERADLPTCAECEYQFTGEDIPLSAERVRCPECTAVYNLKTATDV